MRKSTYQAFVRNEAPTVWERDSERRKITYLAFVPKEKTSLTGMRSGKTCGMMAEAPNLRCCRNAEKPTLWCRQMKLLLFQKYAMLGLLCACTLGYGQTMQDQRILSQVKEILQNEHSFDGMSISARVNHGIVTLDGIVSSQAAKVLATNEIENVDGVKSVMNNLNVVGGAGHPPTAPAIPQNGFTGTKTISLFSGTNLPIRITDEINTRTAKVNDSFHGTLASSIRENGYVLLPTGTPVLGRVIEAKSAGHFTGTAVLSIELVSLKVGTPDGPQNVAVVTQELSSKAAGRGANTAAKTGGGAAVGAVIGALAGGGRGAVMGAASGGALGAGTNAITRGQEIDIKPEQLVQFKTTESLDVTISLHNGQQSPPMAPPGPDLEVRPAEPQQQAEPSHR
jgi:hypothetical protein